MLQFKDMFFFLFVFIDKKILSNRKIKEDLCALSSHLWIDNHMPLSSVVTHHYIKQSIERMSQLANLRH